MSTLAVEKTKILVWDAPTRVFHWLLALSFAGAYATSEGRGLMGVHLTLGYTMAGLVAFRVIWGLIGTRYARFSSFVRGPAAVARYASGMLKPKAEHSVGHNPLGAVSIVLMLLCTLAIVYTGWVYFNGGVHALKSLHEGAAALMATVVGVHVAGVVLASLMQRENLVRAMFNGRKQGRPEQSIRWSWWPVAVLVLASVLGFWWLQWQAPNALGLDSNMSQQNTGLWSGNWRGGDDD